MDNLSQQFYETGAPHPEDIVVEFERTQEI